MERENTRKPASKAFVLSLFVITIILIILLFFIKISPRGVIDPNAVSIRQDSGEIQYKYADGNWQKIVSLEDLKNKDNGALIRKMARKNLVNLIVAKLRSRRTPYISSGDMPGNLNGKIS